MTYIHAFSLNMDNASILWFDLTYVFIKLNDIAGPAIFNEQPYIYKAVVRLR